MDSIAKPNPEASIDGYELVRGLGSGGMAQTWLCRLRGTRGFSRHVVVKTLKPEHAANPNIQAMFLDEARIGALLQHPNIPRVEQFATVADVPYMVQEYVEGPRLTEILKALRLRGGPDLRMSCRVIADVAAALDGVHHAVGADGRPLNLVHRDVSTSNVIVSVRGVAKLIDFGVASFDERQSVTEVGVRKGKMRYMAPEAIEGVDPLTSATDIFALGVLLYACITGRFPWQRHDTNRVSFLGPSHVNSRIGKRLDRLVLAALSEAPEHRPAAREVRAELLAIEQPNGGLLTDDQVAKRITTWFPRGHEDWSPLHRPDTSTIRAMTSMSDLVPPESGSTTSTGTKTSSVTVVQRPSTLGLAILSSMVAVLAFVIVLAGAAGWWFVSTRQAPPAVVATDLGPVLDEAEALLAGGDARAARDLLDQVRALGSSDAADLIRMSRLANEARRLHYRRAAALALETNDPEAARESVNELLREYPSDERGLAWLDELRPPPPVAPEGPRPSGHLVVSSTSGALLTIDGLPIGALPDAAKQVLTPGLHTVSLTKEGFLPATRAVRIDRGKTRRLELVLRPAPSPEAPVDASPPDEVAPSASPVVNPPGASREPEPSHAAPIMPRPTRPHVALVVRRQAALTYPAAARRNQTAAVACKARISVDDRGVPIQVQATVNADCPASFRDATVEGLMRWRWQPHRENGERVPADTTAIIRFEPDR